MTPIPVSLPSIGKEELDKVGEVFKTGWLGMGSFVYEFEQEIQKFLNTDRYVICTNTGTSALHLALDAAGISLGDEVITPSLTFAGAVQSIISTLATPVFCDVNIEDLNMDPSDIESKITEYTKAIMPMHYRGYPCKMDEIYKIAADNNLRVIEDAAHAFGSFYKGKKIGSYGDIQCFSFDPIKNITCGEGGAIVIKKDNELLDLIHQKRIVGIDNDTWSRYKNERNWEFDVVTNGYRYHMSNINAAIGLVQLSKFNKLNERKTQVARRYDEEFSKLSYINTLVTDYNNPVFTYVMRITDGRRDQLMKHLKDNGVASGVHYIPVHTYTFFKDADCRLPVTEKIYEQIITLPLFPDITDNQVSQVINAVKAF